MNKTDNHPCPWESYLLSMSRIFKNTSGERLPGIGNSRNTFASYEYTESEEACTWLKDKVHVQPPGVK